MSDPNDIPGRRRPPRAEPGQPDKPLGDSSANTEPADTGKADAAERQKKQSDAALENVREGYD